MSECTHNCSTCGESCSERKEESLLAPLNSMSSVKKVIGIVSGKGGVGKSLVTSLTAAGMQKRDQRCAILDADITGPSIPKMFGLTGMAKGNEFGILPAYTESGIEVMSVNLLLEDKNAPVIWRGPIIAGTVKQFWTDVVWDDVDYMFVDMPPGTGDVPLTVFQSLPVDGIIVVASPQELVSMIVAKAVKMAQMMNIPILGLVQNNSYVECPDCGKKISVFGESHIEETAKEYGLDVLARIPINPEIAKACDEGRVEEVDAVWLSDALDKIQSL